MSPDWHWPVILVFVVPPALGHLYHFVLAINFVSGLGYREALMNRVRTMIFAGLWISSAYLLWKHIHHPWWTWSWPLFSYAAVCSVSGLLIWPLNSLRLALRPTPAGITGRVRMLDLAAREGTEALCGEGPGAWLLRLPRNESFQLAVREWDLTIPGLPKALDGFEIVQLTDLHFAPCYNRRFFELATMECRVWNPDLLIVTGDLVEDHETIGWIEPVLGHLESRRGKFAVLGNHDQDHQPEAITGELERLGFTTLEGQWTTLELGGTTLAIGGTSAPWGRLFEAQEIPPADFRILLSHSPDLFYRAQDWKVELMFSGHNHGGQIRLPLVGAVFVPSKYSRRFDRGFFRQKGTLLYVSEGLGGMHPVRYHCPPEVCRFVLRAGSLPTMA
jgi:predicted MPP superfamily phosphohydrolase